MKKGLLHLVLFFSIFIVTMSLSKCVAQTISLQTLGSLQPFCNETSGLEQTDSTSIWTHNDSGGKPRLYHYLLNGQLIDSTVIAGASNVDWEDLANDHNGTLFIGDFGNNFCTRTNLRIYRVSTYALASGTDTVFADTISFSYPDQNAFPPSGANLNFDCEAMIHSGDSLYLFSKNISSSSTGYTKCYRLPAVPGNYVAELIDSFYTNQQVTSADISETDSTFILLAYQSVYIFRNYSQNHFFSVTPEHYAFTSLTQKESVLLKNKNQFYLSDERFFGTGGNLYLADIISGTENPETRENNFLIYPNPCSSHFAISGENMFGYAISIFDVFGKEVYQAEVIQPSKIINVELLAAGIYFLKINFGKITEWKKIVIRR